MLKAPFLALAAFALLGCFGDPLVGPDDPTNEEGLVLALTNRAEGNEIAVFHRAIDGSLASASVVPTGGIGAGMELANQGALALSADRRWVFAANAGSNDISIFEVSDMGVGLVSRTSSGGQGPISIAVRGRLLYVLNAGGDGGLVGFTIQANGSLQPIPGAALPLSGTGTVPAQVGISPDGQLAVVSERATNQFSVYTLNADGALTGPTVHASVGLVPFGFDWTVRGELIVSEARGGPGGESSAVSSYAVSTEGTLTVLTASLATAQLAACWLVISPDGSFAFVANTNSNTISRLRIRSNGVLELEDGGAAAAITDEGPADLAITASGRYLYSLNFRAGTLNGFRLESDGRLVRVTEVDGLPSSATGLLAW